VAFISTRAFVLRPIKEGFHGIELTAVPPGRSHRNPGKADSGEPHYEVLKFVSNSIKPKMEICGQEEPEASLADDVRIDAGNQDMDTVSRLSGCPAGGISANRTNRIGGSGLQRVLYRGKPLVLSHGLTRLTCRPDHQELRSGNTARAVRPCIGLTSLLQMLEANDGWLQTEMPWAGYIGCGVEKGLSPMVVCLASTIPIIQLKKKKIVSTGKLTESCLALLFVHRTS